MSKHTNRNSQRSFLVKFEPYSREDKRARREFNREQRELVIKSIKALKLQLRKRPKTMKDFICTLRTCTDQLSNGLLVSA